MCGVRTGGGVLLASSGWGQGCPSSPPQCPGQRGLRRRIPALALSPNTWNGKPKKPKHKGLHRPRYHRVRVRVRVRFSRKGVTDLRKRCRCPGGLEAEAGLSPPPFPNFVAGPSKGVFVCLFWRTAADAKFPCPRALWQESRVDSLRAVSSSPAPGPSTRGKATASGSASRGAAAPPRGLPTLPGRPEPTWRAGLWAASPAAAVPPGRETPSADAARRRRASGAGGPLTSHVGPGRVPTPHSLGARRQLPRLGRRSPGSPCRTASSAPPPTCCLPPQGLPPGPSEPEGPRKRQAPGRRRYPARLSGPRRRCLHRALASSEPAPAPPQAPRAPARPGYYMATAHFRCRPARAPGPGPDRARAPPAGRRAHAHAHVLPSPLPRYEAASDSEPTGTSLERPWRLHRLLAARR